MEEIRKIQMNLDEQIGQQLKNYWDCSAKNRFSLKFLSPMASSIKELNTQTDTLQELCDASMAIADSVCEPDQDERKG